MKAPISITENVRPIMAALKTLSLETRPRAERGEPAPPFITVSRQPGSGAWTLAQEFVEKINADHPDGPHWTCWDRELVEKVAADHHLSEKLIESLEDTDHSWLAQFLSGISFSGDYDAMRIYRRVAATIRALAQAGHVAIVGRGSGFITRNMAGGIHLRLVAPLEHRICVVEHTMNMTRQQAADWIVQAERTRNSFYKRFWPEHVLGPEEYSLTINTARLESEEIVKMLRSLVEAPRPVVATA